MSDWDMNEQNLALKTLDTTEGIITSSYIFCKFQMLTFRISDVMISTGSYMHVKMTVIFRY